MPKVRRPIRAILFHNAAKNQIDPGEGGRSRWPGVSGAARALSRKTNASGVDPREHGEAVLAASIASPPLRERVCGRSWKRSSVHPRFGQLGRPSTAARWSESRRTGSRLARERM
jgi:hypothetical protein